MLAQDGFDLHRIDVHAAADQHVLAAPGNAEKAIGIETTEIARVVPTVAKSLGAGSQAYGRAVAVAGTTSIFSATDRPRTVTSFEPGGKKSESV